MAIPYPDSLPNPLYSGFQNNPSQDYFVTEMDYASKRRPRYYGIFKIPMTFKYSGQQFNDFNAWYYGNEANQLSRGIKTFSARWNVLGVVTTYEFAFVKDGQPQALPIAPDTWEVKIEVELKTDIYEIIALNSLDGFCPDVIDCQQALINLGL